MMQSLPSFAQAFSTESLSENPLSNALPPIQHPKKRSREDNRPPPELSPVAVRVKEEDDRDIPPRSPSHSRDSSVAPSVPKRRRVTLSGPPADSPEPGALQLQKNAPPLARSPPADQSSTPKLPRGPTRATRPCSPPPMIAPPPDPSKPPPTHSLAPPPISFARRRAAQPGARKKKPADILISPRGAGPSDPLAPLIQSAPPVPDPGRFPMAIPRLPLALTNTQSTRRVAGNVPPTPTRFSLQGNAPTRTAPSPPSLSVPIASAVVPPTPHALQLPGYSGDKSAFLAPFEVFYDALNDSKRLKSWLSEQLQKSNALVTSLKQQQDKMDDIVQDLVEKRTRAMRDEMAMLRQRMESLEEALLAVRAESSSTRGQDAPGFAYPKSHQNGADARFPGRAPDAIPGATSEQEHQSSMSPPGRRLSISATSGRSEGSFTLGGHCRRPSGSQSSAKTTPRLSSSARPADARAASRMYYAGTYGNGIEAQTSRDGPKT